MFKISAFYKFASVNKPLSLQEKILNKFTDLSIKGTLLIGKEGINGTISANNSESLDHAINFIKTINGFENLEVKYSTSKKDPFTRLKVKFKNEIVTIGDASIDPNKNAGEYVHPKDWNNLITDEEVLVLDTRNTYEYSIGSFKNSIQPETKNFREFPAWLEILEESGFDKNKKVAMFCTGGIRCEKASSLMRSKGFENVYHLQGGILNYLEKINEEDSLWNGECFVFDDRVAVNHKLQVGSYDMCHGCRMPITDFDKDSEHYQRGVSCPNCFNKKTPNQKKRYADRQKQVDLAKLRNESHIGPNFKSNKI